MKKILLLSFVFIMSCAGSRPQDASFTGTWKITEENLITNPASSTLEVSASKNLFRIKSTTENSELIQVFDGSQLHTKSSYLKPFAEGMPLPEPSLHSEEAKEFAVGNMRFWTKSGQGPSSPGGSIAGRATLLYQAQAKRPDGDFTQQIWVDEETGVTLKSIESIYSKQVSQVVSKITRECQSFHPGPVDAATFTKP